METFSLLRAFALCLILFAGPASSLLHADENQRADVLLRHCRIIDGTGAPWYLGDIAVRQGKITAIGRLEALPAGASLT